ncbi:hypothetical protein Dimus_000910 [Dionaea muscipula]
MFKESKSVVGSLHLGVYSLGNNLDDCPVGVSTSRHKTVQDAGVETPSTSPSALVVPTTQTPKTTHNLNQQITFSTSKITLPTFYIPKQIKESNRKSGLPAPILCPILESSNYHRRSVSRTAVRRTLLGDATICRNLRCVPLAATLLAADRRGGPALALCLRR